MPSLTHILIKEYWWVDTFHNSHMQTKKNAKPLIRGDFLCTPHSYKLYLFKWLEWKLKNIPLSSYNTVHHKGNRMSATFIYFSRLLQSHICYSWPCCLNTSHNYDLFMLKKNKIISLALSMICSGQSKHPALFYLV